MCASIREFRFKIPVLARSNGEVVDGHLRLKAARKLGSWPGGDVTGIPVILCDECPAVHSSIDTIVTAYVARAARRPGSRTAVLPFRQAWSSPSGN